MLHWIGFGGVATPELTLLDTGKRIRRAAVAAPDRVNRTAAPRGPHRRLQQRQRGVDGLIALSDFNAVGRIAPPLKPIKLPTGG